VILFIFYVDLLFRFVLFPVHIPFFRHEITAHGLFYFALFFFCISLISICYFLLFYFVSL